MKKIFRQHRVEYIAGLAIVTDDYFVKRAKIEHLASKYSDIYSISKSRLYIAENGFTTDTFRSGLPTLGYKKSFFKKIQKHKRSKKCYKD